MWTPDARGEPAPAVDRMAAALVHRGPDSGGLWSHGARHLALGHRRLAIVDLSHEGHQPMASHSGRFTVAFNGEIYNHHELRQSLGPTLPWRGTSDTEVLLAGFERWGIRPTIERSVGMFALAVWDEHRGELTLARDRMGEKPLYYAASADGFAFASELKALRQIPGLCERIDRRSIGVYLRYGFIPGPHTAFEGVRKLPAAHLLVLRDPLETPTPTPHWSLPPLRTGARAGHRDADPAALVEQLEGLLTRTVSRQLLADVPLGAFLSGGIDSSLIVALAQSCTSSRVRTFTMGFGDKANDEAAHAREVARHLGTDHTELVVAPADVVDAVPHLAGVYDEPFADSSQVPTWLLCRLTRQHVTVALSGDGGDELFGGYNRYMAAQRVAGLRRSWPQVARSAIGTALSLVPSSGWELAARAFRSLSGRATWTSPGEKMQRLAALIAAHDDRQAYLSLLSASSVDLTPPGAALPWALDLPYGENEGLVQRMTGWDIRTYLPDDILVKVDRAAMACSLETRAPFLDHEVVEFAASLPLGMKLRGGQSKWLLRELLARRVPRQLFERPKQGFTLPIDAWLRGPLRDWAEDLLGREALAGSGLVDIERARELWSEHLQGRRNRQRALWTVLMLQAWLRQTAPRLP